MKVTEHGRYEETTDGTPVLITVHDANPARISHSRCGMKLATGAAYEMDTVIGRTDTREPVTCIACIAAS